MNDENPTTLTEQVSKPFSGHSLFKVYFWTLLIVGLLLFSAGFVWPLLGYKSTVVSLLATIYLMVGVPVGLYFGVKKLSKTIKELKESSNE